MIRTVTYDDAKFKIVPIEPSEEMLLSLPSVRLLSQVKDLVASEYKAMIAAAPEHQEPTKDE